MKLPTLPATEDTPNRACFQVRTPPEVTRAEADITLPPPDPDTLRGRFDGLYIHVPFCFHKCHYCDFYSVVNGESRDHARQAAFADALLRELHHWAAATPPEAPFIDAHHGLCPSAIFVGGGTPTLFHVEHWRRLLDTMHALGVMSRVDEFTVEANPETVTPELLHVLVEGGVNRVSIGAQSFDEHTLRSLERWHDPASVASAMTMSRAAGIGRINLDLIFAAPGQTLEGWKRDLERALELEPTHLSCYGLTYEPATVLTKKLALGRVVPTQESVERAMYEHTLDRLAAAGFEQYEVSAWARGTATGREKGSGVVSETDQRCRMNLLYWRGGSYLGLGPSAASHHDGRRWKTLPHIGRYATYSPRPPLIEDERLTDRERVEERLMLGLRLNHGIDAAWIDATASRVIDHLPQAIAELTQWGMLTREDGHLKLTRRGLLVADSVLARMV